MTNKNNNKIFWIASYPKSGNTWMRAMLSALFFTFDGKFDFHLLKRIGMFENADAFEFVKDISERDYLLLNRLETISKYWEKCQYRIKSHSSITFLKTHHACISHNNNNFTTPKISKGFIYLVRDPRDVAISYSNHLNMNIDSTIEIMKLKNATNYFPAKKKELQKKYKAYLSSWDDNINSWLNLNIPNMFIRYEDLLKNNREILISLIKFFEKNYNLHFNNSDSKIANIIKTTTFNKLQNHEKKYGFDEQNKKRKFFRKGYAGQWKEILTKEQIKKIEITFGDKMEQFGYL